jgi:hypothetical protein
MAVVLIWGLLGSDRNPPSGESSPQVAVPTPSAEAPNLPGSGRPERLYSIPLYRLNGLSPSTQPGTGLEVWVSWSGKVLDDPKLQRLIPRVLLESIESGPSPEAPSIVTLRVPDKQIPNLIWAELFGEIAIATRPD